MRIATRASRFTIVTCTAWRTPGFSSVSPTLAREHHSLGATFLGSQGDLIVGTCSPENGCQTTNIVNRFTQRVGLKLGRQRSGMVL